MVQTRFAHEFYKSAAWMKCAKAYRRERAGLCERYLKKSRIVPGEEVHHKIRLTPENINDPAVALCWDNLELLCKDCHKKEHRAARWRADEMGKIAL